MPGFIISSLTWPKRALGLYEKCRRIMNTSTVAPPISRIALMICTQVVAFMPPKRTYTIISAPTPMTAWMYFR